MTDNTDVRLASIFGPIVGQISIELFITNWIATLLMATSTGVVFLNFAFSSPQLIRLVDWQTGKIDLWGTDSAAMSPTFYFLLKYGTSKEPALKSNYLRSAQQNKYKTHFEKW